MNHYVIRVEHTPQAVSAHAWDGLLYSQSQPTPFMRHAYLAALHGSGSACQKTGWQPHFLTLSDDAGLAAACVVFGKAHSYGEYVFDWAWANAYHSHGLHYYPKALTAVPFTPVPGARLLARNEAARRALVRALLDWSEGQQMSSLHILFATEDDIEACRSHAMLLRHGVQFHWHNSKPSYASFDAFLATLSQDKRKKIRQERRKVSDAGVQVQSLHGAQITPEDWDFFYRCYERTYLEHGNAPYLNRAFFAAIASAMPEHWLLFIAMRDGVRIAASLVGLSADAQKVAYGRYWGALERVDCLHFELCYYQPLQWCIEHDYLRFEGGAQGEHKMARALMPVQTTSAHWLAHPAFARAVEQFLSQEEQGMEAYMEELKAHAPFRQTS